MEETTKNVTESQQTAQMEGQQETNQKPEGQQGKTPTIEELMARIAETEAENQRLQNKNNTLQNKNNTLSSENAETKRALRAKQTAEEIKSAEEEEARRLDREEKEAMRKELNHIKAVAAYKNIPDEKTVENLIAAIAESDHASISVIIENEKVKAVKEAKAEWQKSIPQPQFGTGEYSSMSKKDILAIKDTAERQKAILANRNLFGI